MTNIDERISAGLSADDQAFLNDLESGQGLFEQVGATFSGPMKFWVGFAFVFSFAMFAVSVFGLYQMFQAETVKLTILWSMAALFGMIGVSMLKMWFWMRMNHLVVLKQLKLIELRLTQLGN